MIIILIYPMRFPYDSTMEWVGFFFFQSVGLCMWTSTFVHYRSPFLQESKSFHKHVLNLIKSFICRHFHLMKLIIFLDKKQENKYQYLWLRRLIIHERYGPFLNHENCLVLKIIQWIRQRRPCHTQFTEEKIDQRFCGFPKTKRSVNDSHGSRTQIFLFQTFAFPPN